MIATRVANILRIFCPDLLGILDFTVRARFLGDAIEHLVLLLDRFQIFLTFFSDFLYCFTVSDLLPTIPPIESLMVRLVRMPL